MKKSNNKASLRGIKRNAKNKARMKKNQDKYSDMLAFLEKVVAKHGNLYTKEYADQIRRDAKE